MIRTDIRRPWTSWSSVRLLSSFRLITDSSFILVHSGLIDLDDAVDLAYEPEASEKTDGSLGEEEEELE